MPRTARLLADAQAGGLAGWGEREHLARRVEVHATQEIDGGTEAMIGEPQILRGIPGHGALLLAPS